VNGDLVHSRVYKNVSSSPFLGLFSTLPNRVLLLGEAITAYPAVLTKRVRTVL
jgi:hypothetical protein